MIDIEKLIIIKYNSLDELFEREEAMLNTLNNYLERNKEYEFVESYISQSETKAILNLKIKLRDEYNS